MRNLENTEKLIELLFNGVISEGGDGSAIWLAKHNNINDIYSFICDYNVRMNINWKVSIDNDGIVWSDNQESITITTDEEWYNKQPMSFYEIKVIY
jgi:hypothetical protein